MLRKLSSFVLAICKCCRGCRDDRGTSDHIQTSRETMAYHRALVAMATSIDPTLRDHLSELDTILGVDGVRFFEWYSGTDDVSDDPQAALMEFVTKGMNGRVRPSSPNVEYERLKLIFGKSLLVGPHHGCHPNSRPTDEHPIDEHIAVSIQRCDEKLDWIGDRIEQLVPRKRASYFDWVALLTILLGVFEALVVLVDFVRTA